uniref:Uncharacterized protein n=1 Tax=Setaria viridis TaxID=4556 RepID=A0A4U6SY91_SETVI|nr:hypothetical protein SEVIR_9G203000v2 [Setaria viridis]
MAAGSFVPLESRRRSLRRYVYQHAEKSGWILSPTCFGGLLPLRVVLLSGEPGPLVVLEVPDPLTPRDAMADGHLLLLRHSMCVVWLLRSPAMRMTGRILQGLGCNFSFLQGCLCKNWNVNTMSNINPA